MTSLAPDERVLYAKFWLRTKAFGLDCVVLALPFLLLQVLGVDKKSVTYQVVSTVIVWLYFAIGDSSPWQATFGKHTFHLKVTDLRGERIGFTRASVRCFARGLSSLIFAIGYLMCFWTERRQTLHDKIAGCLVVDCSATLRV